MFWIMEAASQYLEYAWHIYLVVQVLTKIKVYSSDSQTSLGPPPSPLKLCSLAWFWCPCHSPSPACSIQSTYCTLWEQLVYISLPKLCRASNGTLWIHVKVGEQSTGRVSLVTYRSRIIRFKQYIFSVQHLSDGCLGYCNNFSVHAVSKVIFKMLSVWTCFNNEVTCCGVSFMIKKWLQSRMFINGFLCAVSVCCLYIYIEMS